MNDHLENQLRAELRRHAERAPGSTLLADRIIAAARTQPRPAGRGWPTWTLPLITAAAVAAIVTGVFVGVSQLRTEGSPIAPRSGGGTFRPSFVQTSPAPTPTVSATVSPSQTTNPPNNAVGLSNFVATDLTFVGTDNGWALGTADCLRGSGTCPAMVRTTDGGKSWHSMPNPPGGVTGIRFATDQIGYAYSASVLEMTTDGGQSWQTESGGAVALETLDNNVIRVQAVPPGGCPPGCVWTISTAPLGSASWTPAPLPGGGYPGDGLTLARTGHFAYLLSYGHTAGGAGLATSVMFRSADDGATWSRVGEPCPQSRRSETDSVALAAAPGGITALCQLRQAGAGPDFLAKSADGVQFAATGGTVPQFGADVLAGDPSTVLVAAGSGAYRSTDGGASWDRIPEIAGDVSFVGFESPTLGRIVTDGGRTIWTTRDGGAHWSAFQFPN